MTTYKQCNKTVKTRWEPLADLPLITRSREGCFARPVWILNDHEFVISVCSRDNRNALYKYDSYTNLWLPVLAVLREESGYFDKEIDIDNGRVFLIHENGVKMLIFDIESPRQFLYRITGSFASGKMVNVNGCMHYVGCDAHPFHRLWNEKLLEWQPINTKPVTNVKSIEKLLHVPSKNIVLMFGTMEGDSDKRRLWRYHIQPKQWEYVRDLPSSFGFSAVLTSDEQFLVIAMLCTWHFHILDIRNDDNYKFRQSLFKFPRNNSWGTLARSGKMKNSFATASGWIRRQKKSKGLDSISIPLVIEQMIAGWYSTEWIHWIVKRESKASNVVKHQRIPLNDILNVKL